MSILQEDKLDFDSAAASLPGRRGRLHVSVIHRWASQGLRSHNGQRVVLESLKIGGVRYTSRQAIERFLESLNVHNAKATTAPRSPTRRRRASEQASHILDRLGMVDNRR